MGEEPEGLLVRLAREEPASRDVERRRGGVLEAAAAPIGEVHDEEVPLVREPAHERPERLDDLARVVREPRLVHVPAPPQRDLVGLPERAEAERPVRADLDGRVGELVVVARDELARAALERGRDAPARRREDLDRVRLRLAAARVREDRRRVHEPVRPVEVAGAHRQLVRVDAAAEQRALRAARPEEEAVLVEPLEREWAAGAILGRGALDVPRELPDEVAPRGPDREHQLDGLAGPLDERLDVEEVRMRFGHREPVTHALRTLAWGRPRAADFW